MGECELAWFKLPVCFGENDLVIKTEWHKISEWHNMNNLNQTASSL